MSDTQRYTVDISFEMEGDVFPDDPQDVYVLARVEQETLLGLLENLGLADSAIQVTVTPIL